MPNVTVDVSAARCRSREAIQCNSSGDLNPGEARRLAEALLEAAAWVDRLCPPRQLEETHGH